jgi:cation transport regulator ChaB
MRPAGKAAGGRTARRRPMPATRNREEIPSTIRRSDAHAQEIWAKAHDSAVETYGEGQRAHRTAFAALKHQYEKVGDHWERKAGGRKGPSDTRAASGGPRPGGRSAGGVDANASKEHLYGVAKRLKVPNRSRMTKDELVRAIEKANTRRTAKARGD